MLFVFKSTDAQTMIGLKGGLSYTDIMGRDALGVDFKTAYHAGWIISHIYDEDWGFELETLYSIQGGKSSLAQGGIDFKLQYIQIPILVSYTIAPRFFIQAGPQLGLNLKGEAIPYNNNLVASELGGLNLFDVSAIVGLTYKSKTRYLVQLRYNQSLFNLFKDSIAKNRFFSLSFGYLLRTN